MTIEEKTKLARDIEILPVEKLSKALEILHSYKSNDKGNNELEFEIGDLDTETLWELDRLVTNWKKSRNKKPRNSTHGLNIVAATKGLRSKLKKNVKDKEGDQNKDADESDRDSRSSDSDSSSSDSNSSDSDSTDSDLSSDSS
jgi:hypothetical protein